MKTLTGFRKGLLYGRIAVHVAIHYLFRLNPWRYAVFLRRAAVLLARFWPDKAVRTCRGTKLQLYLPAYPSKAFFHALEAKLVLRPPGPATVVYSITKACSFHCPHCYQRRDRGKDVSIESLVQTALKLRDAGVALFDIEGGEPFHRMERLETLLDALDDRSEIWVNTNGALVDREKLERLRGRGLLGLMVSIHSPDAKEHDVFTGREGAFEAACGAVRLCRRLGLSAAINSVLTRDQLLAGRLDALMDLAKELDADFVQLIHPKPSGAWLGADDRLAFDADLIRTVRAAHRRYNSAACADYPGLAAQVFEERLESFGCSAGGIDRLYVGASGELQPCEFLNISFGNIDEEGFETVYRRMRSYFPKPCADWLCCTQAPAIAAKMHEHRIDATPLPWTITKELVEEWDRGEPTPLYEKLRIYSK